MRREERLNDTQTALLLALQGWQADMWTAMPGIVIAYDAAAETLQAQIAIQARVTNPDGTFEDVSISPVIDVPVVFPQGGGYTLTFPIAAGDECLLVFASRCLDGWWQLGGTRPQLDARMHDISDAFAIVGARSQARLHVPSPSTARVELRNDAGTALFSIDGSGHARVLGASQVTITAPVVHVEGDLTVSGTVTADGAVVGAGIGLSTHHHGGVSTGSGNTGGPAG